MSKGLIFGGGNKNLVGVLLRGNAVCILFISSERVGTLCLNFAALIQVSIEIFEIPIFKI